MNGHDELVGDVTNRHDLQTLQSLTGPVQFTTRVCKIINLPMGSQSIALFDSTVPAIKPQHSSLAAQPL